MILTKAGIPKVKELAKNLLFNCEQIEVHDHLMKQKIDLNNQRPESVPEDEIEMHARYIRGYMSNIEKLLS